MRDLEIMMTLHIWSEFVYTGTVFVQPESVDSSPSFQELETSRTKSKFRGARIYFGCVVEFLCFINQNFSNVVMPQLHVC